VLSGENFLTACADGGDALVSMRKSRAKVSRSSDPRNPLGTVDCCCWIQTAIPSLTPEFRTLST